MPTDASSENNKIIVYDLDGTLVDSARDLIATLNKVIEKQGLDPIDYRHVGSIVGQGALRMLDRAYEFYGKSLAEDLKLEMHKEFLEIYSEHLADKTVPYEGVIDVLDKMKSDGWIQAVCTNKYEGMSVKLLKQLQLDHYFSAICGSDTFPVRKPDPAHLIGTIDRANGNRNRCVMIGDSITDVKTAKAAEIPVIAVTFGYSDVPVSKLGPTAIVNNFNAIPEVIESIFED